MLRFLTPLGNRPIKATYTAAENMYQGMGVTISTANGTCSKATGVGDYIVDVPKSYTGLYAVVNPEDDTFESIASGTVVNVIPTFIGDRIATDQLTIASLVIGDPMDVASGLFIEATSGDSYQWVYGGTYSDPTGTMYIAERVALATV